MLRLVSLLLAALALTGTARACGMMFPKAPDLPPLAMAYQRVKVNVDNLVAVTRVDQAFRNNTGRQLEATYVFPLPRGASVTEFALWIDGKRTKAEMMERQKARQIYEDIVRQAKDPGLLEYLGEDLFQARVFPVPAHGEQRVEIVYQQQLQMDAGLAEYRFPLKGLEGAPPHELTVELQISSKVPIRSVYSPTHNVAVRRDDDHTARASFEQSSHSAQRDFSVFLTASEKDFGLNLLCSRQEGEEGYFALMLAPRQEVDTGEVVKRDVCFVLDTSGSMQGEKMSQAREALKFCVRALNPGDRFNVLAFATDVDSFSGSLVDASRESVEKAVAWIDRLEAMGGTAIDDALASALSNLKESDRPSTVVFMTDGLPTIGETRPDRILENVSRKSPARTRLFALGVGESLNAKLLDRLAGDNRGVPVYISPGEDIEVKVSSFYAKISNPVLTDLKLDYGTVETFRTYPSELPDLYSGSQLVVYGRYRGQGATKVTLSGKVNGKDVSFSYDASFPQVELEREFIPRLWATRRVGYLLDQVRQHGEQTELKDEVIALARRYGIVTPYTSYLVVEDEAQLAGPPAPARPFIGGLPSPGGAVRGMPMAAPQAAFEGEARQDASQSYVDKLSRMSPEESGRLRSQVQSYMKAESGADAVAASRRVQELKEADSPADANQATVTIKTVEGRTFELKDGVWVDSGFDEKMEKLEVVFGSAAYFDVLFAHAELKKALALGEKVVIVVGGKALVVGEKGKTEITAEEMKAFFG